MSSDDNNVRTDEYWMGVRDALRMVDSFNKWSTRNPGRAKSLDNFIHDGLIAAAKRCESCLRDKLGISFTEDEDEKDEIVSESLIELHVEDLDDDDDEDDEVILEKIIEFEDETDEEDRITLEQSIEPEDEPEEPESSFEETISHVEPGLAPPPDVSDELLISLDSVERIEDEQMEDLSIEGPQREFSTDFELVEPTPLVVDEDSTPEPLTGPEPEPEEFVSEPAYEEEVTSTPEPEELPDKPSFTWSEYEEAVTPSSEPEPLDSEVDFDLSENEPLTVDKPEEVSEEPPEPPNVWSSYDKPSFTEEEEDIDEEDEPVISDPEPLEEGEDKPVISEPPSPPPPPESEEDEEERKRRARRLFFGA